MEKYNQGAAEAQHLFYGFSALAFVSNKIRLHCNLYSKIQ